MKCAKRSLALLKESIYIIVDKDSLSNAMHDFSVAIANLTQYFKQSQNADKLIKGSHLNYQTEISNDTPHKSSQRGKIENQGKGNVEVVFQPFNANEL